MATVEMTKMSSRGQVVIPQDIRDNMKLKEGESFAVVASGDTLLLKRIATPSKEEILREWKRAAAKGREEAKKLGIRQGDVEKLIHKGRGISG
ncbi:MAG: AbrB/MazE/SpoVT family DNA-binding domain-containing protein [Candidatus Diapherotrites archaeon]